jgi:hypothetical protein
MTDWMAKDKGSIRGRDKVTFSLPKGADEL